MVLIPVPVLSEFSNLLQQIFHGYTLSAKQVKTKRCPETVRVFEFTADIIIAGRANRGFCIHCGTAGIIEFKKNPQPVILFYPVAFKGIEAYSSQGYIFNDYILGIPVIGKSYTFPQQPDGLSRVSAIFKAEAEDIATGALNAQVALVFFLILGYRQFFGFTAEWTGDYGDIVFLYQNLSRFHGSTPY